MWINKVFLCSSSLDLFFYFFVFRFSLLPIFGDALGVEGPRRLRLHPLLHHLPHFFFVFSPFAFARRSLRRPAARRRRRGSGRGERAGGAQVEGLLRVGQAVDRQGRPRGGVGSGGWGGCQLPERQPGFAWREGCQSACKPLF